MSIHIRNCFVCRNEVEVKASAKAASQEEHFFLLSHILEMPDLENYLKRVQSSQSIQPIPYCSICSFRINKIQSMLEQLEEFEKELNYEKSKIEAEFKRNFRTVIESSSPELDNLRNDIVTDLRSDSILSTLDKLKNNEIGRRSQPRRSIRIRRGIGKVSEQMTEAEAEDENHEVTMTENWTDDQGIIVSDLFSEHDVKVEDDLAMQNIKTETEVDPLADIYPPDDEAILPGDIDIRRESEALHDPPSPTIKISFVTSQSRAATRFVHTNSKFKCSQCRRTFGSTEYLRAHIKHVHFKEYDFRCKICNKGCRKQSELKLHMMSHSDKKNYKCWICDSIFKYKGSIGKHFKTFHPGEPWHTKRKQRN